MQVKSRICGRRGMWHACDRREKCARFWWESTKGKDHWEVRAVDWKMGLKWILGRLAGGVEWIQLAQDRDRWLVLVNTVMNLLVMTTQLYRCINSRL
jgi:hypothetical protein